MSPRSSNSRTFPQCCTGYLSLELSTMDVVLHWYDLSLVFALTLKTLLLRQGGKGITSFAYLIIFSMILSI